MHHHRVKRLADKKTYQQVYPGPPWVEWQSPSAHQWWSEVVDYHSHWSRPKSRTTANTPPLGEVVSLSLCWLLHPARWSSFLNRRLWWGIEESQLGNTGCIQHLKWGNSDNRVAEECLKILLKFRKLTVRILRNRNIGQDIFGVSLGILKWLIKSIRQIWKMEIKNKIRICTKRWL